MLKKRVSAQGGFSLIEILLVIAILMGVGVLEMKRDIAKANDAASVAVGRQLVLVGGAVEQYMAANVGLLQNMGDPNCVPTGDYCVLNLAQLIAQGYLPGTFTNTVLFGGTYTAMVRRVSPPLPATAATLCPNANPWASCCLMALA